MKDAIAFKRQFVEKDSYHRREMQQSARLLAAQR